MRLFKIAVLLLIAFCSCKRNANRNDAPGYEYVVTVEYRNEYENDKIVKSLVTESEQANSNVAVQTSVCEHGYIYKGDSLIGKMEYEIDLLGGKTLQYTTNYSEGKEEYISWKGRDTISYEIKEYNSDSMLVYSKKRAGLLVSVSDPVIASGFEEWILYDTDGRRIEITRRDLSSGEKSIIKFFYNIKPVIRSNEELTVVYFEEKCAGDTIITRVYENDFLVNIYRKYKDEKSKYELTFTPDYDLVLSTETIEKDNEKIVITKSTEFEAVDSLFYLNNKEIRLVSASPDYRTTIINEYDLYGNISKETRIYSTVSRPVVHK